MTSRVPVNPFDLTKASDFSDEQIQQYWVDLAGQAGLVDIIKPRLAMPMLLLGGKGSGKTHLMRYFSAAVQKLRFGGNLLKAAQEEGHLGVFVRADGLNVGRFSGKGQDDDQWATIFSYYFELWLATHLLRNIQECLSTQRNAIDEPSFIEEAKKLFTKEQPASITSIPAFIDHLAELRRVIDHVVANCAITKSLREIDVCITPGQLVFELPVLIEKYTSLFNNVLFVYMIDEVENFNATQQRFLNSLIRYRRGPVSIKIGARLYGIRTKQTLGVGEDIKQNSEYERVELDAALREHDAAYSGLARDLIIKRLQQAGLAPHGDSVNYRLDGYFEMLDPSDNYRNVALALVKKYDDKKERRPYFKELKTHILTVSGQVGQSSSLEKTADEIIDAMSMPNDPLLEKVNVYLLYKDWCEPSRLVDLAKEIGNEAKKYLQSGRVAAPKYFQALDHFKSDFLAQLYHDCDKRRTVYAGLDTLIHLSQGIPRNLLGLLKNIYRRSYFAEEKPFQAGGKISIASQVEGISDAAAWFWDDAQPDRHGKDVRASVEALASLFRGVRYSLKPAECDLSTFMVDSSAGTLAAKEVLNHAENWSYLIRVRDGGVNRNDSTSIDEKYQLSPMLAARWEISEHRRGSIQLQEPLFNAIFDPSQRELLPQLLRERLKGMTTPYLAKHTGQTSLF